MLIFSRRLRMLAERSEYFRSELRSANQQTWFFPNDQAFASLGSNLNFLFDPNFANNTNDINDVSSHCILIIWTFIFFSLVHQISSCTHCSLSKYDGCK